MFKSENRKIGKSEKPIRQACAMGFYIFCFSAFLLFCFQASALTPAELLTPELDAEPIHLIAIRDGRIVYFDRDRVQQSAPVGRFVQVRGIAGRRAQLDMDQPLLETTDGQRLTGRFAGAAEDGSALLWEHPTLGTLRIPLTRTRWARFGSQPVLMTANSAADAVVLANGDTMTGFVEAVEPQRLVLAPDGSDQPIELPTERVAGLVLANPMKQPDEGVNRLVLDDGSQVWARGLAWSDERVDFDLMEYLRAGGGAISDERSLEPARVVRIDLASGGSVLRDLSGLAFEVAGGGEALGVPYLPRVAGGELLLHAPVTLRFKLPESAKRVAGTVRLDLPGSLTEDRRALAHCVLIVRHGGSDEARFELTAEQSVARFNVPIHTGRLEIEAAEGEYGPILDRLRLEDAVLLQGVSQ